MTQPARRGRILVIAPLPPPITGHSLASQVLVDALRETHDVDVVNLSAGSRHDGTVTWQRLRAVGKALLAVARARAHAEVVYFTIAESLAGNLKDLLVYALCAGRLGRVYVHLHGGTIGRALFDRHALVKRLNAVFLRRLGGVIVSGPSHERIFAGLVAPERIHVVPNFAKDEMFVTEEDVLAKFRATQPLRVLYLSAMSRDKGCFDLAAAYGELHEDRRAALRIDFAGRFESDADAQAFAAQTRGLAGIHYHGMVSDAEKRRLFAAAHVFCLPTAMFEGQPISILEAYASGAAVITTGQPGIRDVFEDRVNGLTIGERTPQGIAECLRLAAEDPERLRGMAVGNLRTALARYRTATFSVELRRILAAEA